MATFTLQEPSGSNDGEKRVYTLIPDDVELEAEVKKIEAKTKPFTDDDGNPVVKLEWTFKIIGGEHDGRQIWGETGSKFVKHADCKLYAWSAEVFGAELPDGFTLDTDNLIGEQCRIVTGHRTYTKKGDTEPTTVNNVSQVKRRKTQGAAGFEDPF